MISGRFKYIIFLIITSLSYSLYSQEGVVDYFSFNGCQLTGSVSGQSTARIGNIGCDCGILGDALFLNGVNDGLDSIVLGNRFFEQNFSIRFNFLPNVGDGSFDLLSKKNTCIGDSTFTIRYDGSLDEVFVEATEAIGSSLIMRGAIIQKLCWHEVAFIRRGNEFILYIDGIRRDRQFVNLGLSIINNAPVRISASPCVPDFENRFEGLVDELFFFDRALLLNEIGSELRPDFLITQDTLIFNGGSVSIRSQANCATNFSWSPTTGVSNPSISNPLLSPTVSTTYEVSYTSDQCTTIDSLRVVVVEQGDLLCSQLDLPSAFTPNGDGINDFFGISNPFIIESLLSFDIYDRQGAIVYAIGNQNDTWNGSFGVGERLMPGVYVYKIRYICQSQQLLKIGTVALMR